MKRSEMLEHRIHVQQLDRAEAERAITDAALFDFGVQDTGQDGASWALASRGIPVRDAAELKASPDLALAWTLRAAPHFYRRADLPEVLVATSPLSERDAAKRLIGADKPLNEAGIPTLTGLTEVATQLRHVVTRPLTKGEASTKLTARLDPPYLRYCRACKTTHSWEVPFRIGALYAGLELEPGTSPPVLRRIPGWPRRKPGPAPDPLAAPELLQPIRNYLRFLGRLHRTMLRRSLTPRSPKSRRTGQQTRSKSALMAGKVGFWVRWGASSMIGNCCNCSAASTSFSRPETAT